LDWRRQGYFTSRAYAVLITGANPETLEAARRKLPGEIIVLRADARSLEDAAHVASEIEQRFSRLDVAFLNAGVGRKLPIEATDEPTFDEHFAVNVKGQYFMLQKVLPLLRAGSSVIFNSSLSTEKGLTNFSVYSATKGAVQAMVPALAVELAPRGIRVNAVSPGPNQHASAWQARPAARGVRRLQAGRTRAHAGWTIRKHRRGGAGRRLPRLAGGQLRHGNGVQRRWRHAGGLIRNDRV
jgi:NAD(P)-dependent dehydrogenase (short-subunit alcohol dehydrogenase family)